MNTAYVLGAGFSKDYNPEVLPLLGEFLQIATKKTAYEPRHKHRTLGRVLKDYLGSESPDLERALAFLSLQELPDPFLSPEKKRACFDDLVQIIKETLYCAYETPVSDETRKLYQDFAVHVIEQQCNVLTFNYDVIMDNLLAKTGKWSPLTGYGVRLPQSSIEPRFGPTPQPVELHGQSPLLLKLHGSLNWGRRTIPDAVTGNDFFVFPGFLHVGYEEIGVDTTGITADWPIATIENWGDTGLGYRHSYKCVIVPPGASKNDLLENRFLLNVWHIARETLRNARVIVFIGYSFPRTDFLFETLMAEALGASNVATSERTIVVVNPDKTPADQAKRFFQGASVSWESQRTDDFLKTFERSSGNRATGHIGRSNPRH